MSVDIEVMSKRAKGKGQKGKGQKSNEN